MINRKLILSLAVSLLGACTSGSEDSAAGSSGAQEKPNIVVIFTDDMGYGDMSNNGHPTIKTANLDRMAAEGQKWTNFYVAASVCTPSRAGLLTGRLPVRSGMASSQRRVLFPDSNGGLPQSEITIAEHLKSLGYSTGMVGKWHLGHLPEYLPTNNGFDSWYGIPYSNDMDMNFDLVAADNDEDWEPRHVIHPENPGVHWENPKSEYWDVPLMQGEEILERAPDQHQLTKDYTERAVEFIQDNKDGPFFLYLAHSMPHVPLFTSEEFMGVSTAGLYGDVIEEIDWSVGQVIKTLEEEGLAENTLVVFTSDNGPWHIYKTQGGSAGPLRGAKGMVFEGGMREPTIFWWPGKIQPAIVHDIGSTLDILPTSSRLAGGSLDYQVDGYDLTDVMIDGGEGPREEMFFYGGDVLRAVRLGRYKAHFYDENREKLDQPWLYDLNEDPGEKYDIAADNPEVVAQLAAFALQHEQGVVPVENQLEK
ncbi:MAG: sulfatase [Pseudomonadales bacterium]